MSFFLLLSIPYIKNTSMVREEIVTALKVIFKLIFLKGKVFMNCSAPLVLSFLHNVSQKNVVLCVERLTHFSLSSFRHSYKLQCCVQYSTCTQYSVQKTPQTGKISMLLNQIFRSTHGLLVGNRSSFCLELNPVYYGTGSGFIQS